MFSGLRPPAARGSGRAGRTVRLRLDAAQHHVDDIAHETVVQLPPARPRFPGEWAAGRFGEVNRVGAPVGGVASSLHESPVFEVVDEPGHDVAVEAHRVGEVLLGLPVVSCQAGEQAEMRGAQAQRPQPFAEPRGGAEAELGDQEAGTLGQRVVCGDGP